jgi:hypothetical protein
LFRAAIATKQFSCATKPLSISTQNSGNGRWLPVSQQERRTAPAEKTGDSQMRILSFLLAFAFVVAGPTLAGSPDGSVPGFGTFAYSGSALVSAAPSLVVAAR